MEETVGRLLARMPGGRSRAILAAAAGGSLLLAWGCVGEVPYRPDDRLAASVGTGEAKQRMSQILKRAREPRITTVRPTDDYVQYFWERLAPETALIDPLYVANVAEIHYSTVTGVEVYENNWVFVWGPLRENVDKVLFSSQEDARTFADLVTSFRALKGKKEIPAGPVPASTPKGQEATAKPVKATMRP
jgi:hypothetical protein